MQEITILNERRRDMDIAAEEANRGPNETRMQRTFKAEQTRRDYEMQLGLVKAEFRKLPAIQIEQAKCLKNFNELMFNYHSQMETLLVKHRADKV
ncbi:unnamed protein product [Toxocara canis]|nr:unnamed protein product [Toxocara canis]